jgi:hypothetical protein
MKLLFPLIAALSLLTSAYAADEIKTQSVLLQGSTSGQCKIQAPASGCVGEFTIPADHCTAGQSWQDNGSGVMSCYTPGTSTTLNGAGLVDNAGTLDVNADNSSLEIAADVLQVKALGVTDAMLAGSISFSNLSDSANIGRLDQAESLGAIWDFSTYLPTMSSNPSNDNQAARKQYVDQASKWTKYTVAYSDFTAAATSEAIELLSLPAKTMIEAVVIKHATAFSGGTGTSYTVSVGIATSTEKYASDFDVFQAAADTTKQVSQGLNLESFASAASIKIEATSDVNLNLATAGSVDVWVKTSLLP